MGNKVLAIDIGTYSNAALRDVGGIGTQMILPLKFCSLHTLLMMKKCRSLIWPQAKNCQSTLLRLFSIKTL